MEREIERGAMAESAASTTSTVTETVDGNQPADVENRSITIKLRKRKTNKKVEWTSDTVDNEHLGRRSSKCCCIYEKPRAFGESSSESEDEDGGCGNAHCVRGHKKPFPGGALHSTEHNHGAEHSNHGLSQPPEN
ncbi:E3 ubiquitin-protein ligase PPP1R11 [Rhincodon typus]|uniref:E3 ubiquitin-protein ligase PPP1R11 n=1 Tax=Rhincodon typus TaxID=259920 RepID=UPI00203021F8|nr:E3 ubiquitin-protein ligase PPP1R11 [Rhincodon typus]